MAAATAAARTRKTPNRANGRGLTNYLNSNSADNSLDQFRIQRVMTLTGVSLNVAGVVAALHFGGAA